MGLHLLRSPHKLAGVRAGGLLCKYNVRFIAFNRAPTGFLELIKWGWFQQAITRLSQCPHPRSLVQPTY